MLCVCVCLYIAQPLKSKFIVFSIILLCKTIFCFYRAPSPTGHIYFYFWCGRSHILLATIYQFFIIVITNIVRKSDTHSEPIVCIKRHFLHAWWMCSFVFFVSLCMVHLQIFQLKNLHLPYSCDVFKGFILRVIVYLVLYCHQ